MDFLSEKNDCGQSLLSLVSRGNAVIAELLRLSSNVPEPFTIYLKPAAGSAEAVEIEKFSPLLIDFSYLSHQEYHDEQIEKKNLFELDQEFKEKYFPILERFYHLFTSIWKYYIDYEKFMDDLLEGVFTQSTLEDVLKDFDGKQLLSEAVYLYGVMLYVLDMKIPGEQREQLVVAYIRIKGYSECENVDEVCLLCKRTGLQYTPGLRHAKLPKNYPVDYFKRFRLKEEPLQMIIGRLRSDDLYGQLATYPNPKHRSVALANQSAMLFMSLFFSPDILQSEDATMREIVDKHFADNWIISFYMGYTVDLSISWESFAAARAALQNTMEPRVIRMHQQYHTEKLPELRKWLSRHLMEGIMDTSYVLDNVGKLINAARDMNVALRWLLLHATSGNRKIIDIVLAGVTKDSVLQLLLDVAQYEYILKNILNELLDSKEENWTNYIRECCERMHELSEYFSGEKALTRVEKHEQLSSWFAEIEKQIESLDFDDATYAGRKIKQLARSLNEIADYHMIMDNFHIKRFLSDTVEFLTILLKTVNIKESMMISLSIISDFSYATQLIVDYVDLMQERIKRDPSNVIKLRSTFLKQASMLDIPLVRINQANSPDLISVSKYYSGTLVSYVRHVLEVIPQSMFHLLNEILKVQTYKIDELPTRVELSQLKTFAQLEERSELAELTHNVSLFTRGILAMETTLVGVVKVEPKQLLEDGIRKELVLKISTTLNNFLQFAGDKAFVSRLAKLADTLEGFRRSFEYISDYVSIYGMKMWQEEFTRIIGFNVDMECNEFLKQKIRSSKWQSDTIPIPRFPRTDGESVNFIGRLARELLDQTSFRNTVYVEQLSAWIDRKSGDERVGLRTFSVLHKSIGTPGLYGLDRLLSFMIVQDLQQYIQNYRSVINEEDEKYLSALEDKLNPNAHGIAPQYIKIYSDGSSRFSKIWNNFYLTILIIGHKQLLRWQIANELNFACKLDANVLFSSLKALNSSILKDVKNHYRSPDSHQYPGAVDPAADSNGTGETKSTLLSILGEFLDNSGVQFPLHKIYVTTEPLPGFSVLLCLFVISTVPKFSWDFNLGAFVGSKTRASKKELVDGSPYIMGIITLLKQFHSRHTEDFISMLGQFIRTKIHSETMTFESASAKVQATQLPDSKSAFSNFVLPNPFVHAIVFPYEVSSLLWFLENFCRFSRTPRELVEQHVPEFVFDVKSHFISV